MSVHEFRRPPPPDEPTTPHLSGRCVCLGCKHEWVGVVPVGVISMECPQCHLQKGVHVGIAVPDTAWQCGTCNALLFFMTPAGAQCSVCGVKQRF